MESSAMESTAMENLTASEPKLPLKIYYDKYTLLEQYVKMTETKKGNKISRRLDVDLKGSSKRQDINVGDEVVFSSPFDPKKRVLGQIYRREKGKCKVVVWYDSTDFYDRGELCKINLAFVSRAYFERRNDHSDFFTYVPNDSVFPDIEKTKTEDLPELIKKIRRGK